MLPGATVTYTIGRRTPGGLAVAGKLAADFLVAMYLDGVPASVSPSWAEIGRNGSWQEYACGLVLPATKGQVKLTWQVVAGYDQLSPSADQFALLNNDDDALAAIIASPIVSVVNAGGPQGDIALRLVKNTYAPIAFTVRDQAGNPINLSAYNNPIFAVKNKAQTVLAYSQSSGITMSAGGLVTIGVPETASFYAQLTTGVDQISLYYTLLADEAADTAKTRCLARGPLSVVRTEA